MRNLKIFNIIVDSVQWHFLLFKSKKKLKKKIYILIRLCVILWCLLETVAASIKLCNLSKFEPCHHLLQPCPREGSTPVERIAEEPFKCCSLTCMTSASKSRVMVIKTWKKHTIFKCYDHSARQARCRGHYENVSMPTSPSESSCLSDVDLPD